MFDDLPPAELLETTHSFPCQYTFKVIGRSDPHFVGRVVSAVRVELDESAEPPFSSRLSSGGKHVSVTIEPMMRDAEHVLSVYRSLQQIDGLLMLM